MPKQVSSSFIRNFLDEQVESRYFIKSDTKSRLFLTGAAQEFSPEAYLLYVEVGNSRKTRLIGKRAIYEPETLHVPAILPPHIIQCLGNLSQGADLNGLHKFGKDIISGQDGFLEALQHFRGLFFIPFLELGQSIEL